MELTQLIQEVKTYRDIETEETLNTAFYIASVAHEGFHLDSGERYIHHAMGVASILASWYAPPAVVAVGLLQDSVNSRNTHGYSLETIRRKLGSEISRLLEATTSLNGLIRDFEEDFVSDNEKSIEEDYGRETSINVLLHEASPFVQTADAFVIKIADHSQHLQTLFALNREEQKSSARKTINVFVPLADRLGMGYVRRQFEDASFKITNPAYSDLLQRCLTDAGLEKEVEEVREQLLQALSSSGLNCEVRWQPYSLYSISHHHFEKHTRHGDMFPEEPASLRLEDAGSFVILTEKETDCYSLLAPLHKHYPPVEKQLRDYIGNPSENGYRSLHTQVKYLSGQLLNIIIRTPTMHLVAEYGYTAGWRNAPEEFLPRLHLSTNVDEGKIQIFTPQGEAKYLPLGATPIDFAYELDSDVGNHCKGVRVNGEVSDLFRTLQDGDTVEIIVGGPETQPGPDWLKHVQTFHATHRIQHYLAEQNHNVLETSGRTLLNRELQALGLSSTDAEVNRFLMQLAQKDNLEGPEEILVYIGLGRYKSGELAERLAAARAAKFDEVTLNLTVLSPDAATLPHEIARCCHPTPADTIVGYRRNNRVLVIHNSTCSHIRNVKNTVAVEWDTTPPEPNYAMIVRALDTPGLAAELSGAIARMGVNMLRFDLRQLGDGGFAETHIYLGKTTALQRARMQRAFEDLPYVKSVETIEAASLAKPHLPNPYGPKPAVGPHFYGRDIENQRIRALLCDQSQSTAILLWGQQRIGKTSLLLRMVDQAHGSFLPVYIDLQRIAYCSTSQFLGILINQTFQQLKATIPGLLEEITLPHVNWIKKDPLSHFDRFITSVQKAIQYQPVVIILDEFQYLCALREEGLTSNTIFRHLRGLSQHGNGIHFIFSGGGLLSELMDQTGLASLLNITYDEKLGCLGEVAARNLIKDGLTRVSQLEEEAVEFLLKITSGHPYYLQLLCYKLFEQAQQRTIITQLSASEATYEWLRQADDSRFEHLWVGNQGKDLQTNKVILSAIAQLQADNGEVDYDHIADAVHLLIKGGNLVRSLEDLTLMGVLKHNQLNYAIEVDLFAWWLRQHWPLKLALKEASLL
jgi:GTP diphosphokinase / guanosine-3',5'-bis(diphosphate) 3'-diphosphatase